MRALQPTLSPLPTAGVLCALAGMTATAVAAPVSVSYGRFIETKTIGSPIEAGHTLRVDGNLVDASLPSISNALFFAPASTTLALTAGWLVEPAQNRTVGVNIDCRRTVSACIDGYRRSGRSIRIGAHCRGTVPGHRCAVSYVAPGKSGSLRHAQRPEERWRHSVEW